MWEKSPDTTLHTWIDAVTYCYNKTVGWRKGWRLPTVAELASLVDPTQTNPALPSGHPFQNVQSNYYWSSTEYAGSPDYAWTVSMLSGYVGYDYKIFDYKSLYWHVWAVRGGK